MHHNLSIDSTIETAVLIGVITQEQDEERVEEYLDELAFLAETAGANGCKAIYAEISKAAP